MLLLFRTKGRSLAALGALLIVLLLAIDTFFQQVVIFSDGWTLSNTLGEIPRLVRYEPAYLTEFQQGFEVAMYDKNLMPIITEFLYNNGTQPIAFGNGTRPEVPLSCSTSNCTWPIYETLAVCSKCTEVSEYLDTTFTCRNSTIDWTADWVGPLDVIPYPTGRVCGHWLNVTSDNPILLSGYRVNDNGNDSMKGEALLLRTIPLTTFWTKLREYEVGSIAFKDTRNPIFDTLIASATDGAKSVYEDAEPLLNECVLQWCVQTMKSSFAFGRYTEDVLSTVYNSTTGPSPWDSWEVPAEQGGGTYIVYKENVTIEGPISSLGSLEANASYGCDNITTSGVMLVFNDYFPSTYTASNSSEVPRLVYKHYDRGPAVKTLTFNPWQAPNNLTHHLERLAAAMTNAIRSSVSKQMLIGQAYYTEKFVLVRWGWLTFPLLLLLLSLVFLISTIVKTANDAGTGSWKTSAMPTLIYSLPKESQGQFTSSSTWNSAANSKKVRIRLSSTMGWRVSGHNAVTTSPQLPRPAVAAPRGWI